MDNIKHKGNGYQGNEKSDPFITTERPQVSDFLAARNLSSICSTEEKLSFLLKDHVRELSINIGERHVYCPDRLARAADYIKRTFNAAGFEPQSHFFNAYQFPFENIEVTIPGTDKKNEILVIGAHYDSAPDCPAANDNGSGLAALLTLANELKGLNFSRTIKLVAFANEEPPFFQTECMGSNVYAKMLKKAGSDVIGMISLETMGYFTDEPNSQKYPGDFSGLYPTTGNFIAFVANASSESFLKKSAANFRGAVDFPVIADCLPEEIPGVGWSDHWSFWQAGYPAIMITDTAPFRYPHYHEPTDTHEKLDYHKFARVMKGVSEIVKNIANE